MPRPNPFQLRIETKGKAKATVQLSKKNVSPRGLEPRLSEPKSEVLPLHHGENCTVEIKGLEPLTDTV